MTAFSICDVCSLTFPHGETIPENTLVDSKSVANDHLQNQDDVLIVFLLIIFKVMSLTLGTENCFKVAISSSFVNITLKYEVESSQPGSLQQFINGV